MSRAAKAAGFLLVWAMMLFSLSAAVCTMAGDGGLLAAEMRRHAPPEKTGLPEAEYAGVGQMTAGYLTGQEAVFQHTFTGEDGSIYLCFQEHEAAHMADCRELISLAGTLRWVLGCCCLLFFGMGVIFRGEKRSFARGMTLGLWTAGGLCAAILLWAAADFDGLFTAFHRVAFRNDGWLLDPRTDLLIRLMPTDFFVSLAVRALAAVIAAGAVAAAAAIAMTATARERTGV